jgi:mRNA-degrading endonuclease RelE of RelBE toxin-antitoxin system
VLHDRVVDRAGGVVEEQVDPLGTGLAHRAHEIVGAAMIDPGVVAELPAPGELRVRAGDRDGAATRELGQPFRSDRNVKPLTGVRGAYRRRFGDWRVSYLIDQRARVIEVFEVAPRGGAYR